MRQVFVVCFSFFFSFFERKWNLVGVNYFSMARTTLCVFLLKTRKMPLTKCEIFIVLAYFADLQYTRVLSVQISGALDSKGFGVLLTTFVTPYPHLPCKWISAILASTAVFNLHSFLTAAHFIKWLDHTALFQIFIENLVMSQRLADRDKLLLLHSFPECGCVQTLDDETQSNI